MAEILEVRVPDIGEADNVTIAEVLVAVGDTVAEEDSLVTLESDKASMEIPAPQAGTVKEIRVAEDDEVAEDAVLVVLEVVGSTNAAPPAPEEVQPPTETTAPPSTPAPETPSTPAAPSVPAESSVVEVQVPDIGEADNVTIAEVLVSVGDTVAEEDSLVTLESDKASMEIPAPSAGTVKEVRVQVDDEVDEGAVLVVLESTTAAAPVTTEAAAAAPAPPAPAPTKAASAPEPPKTPPTKAPSAVPAIDEEAFAKAYASPGVRRFARELGVDLGRVSGTGRKGRITREDVQAFVKAALAGAPSSTGTGGGAAGFDWPAMPEIDFSKFGEVEEKKLPRIRQVSARNLHRSWLHVPHVTQHHEADITEMEAFRKAHSEEAKKKGFKLTPVAFQLKACAQALREFPEFNSSLHPSGKSLILKKYLHIGVAVDTPNGLVVPVIRDVDKKGIYELGSDLLEISGRAREGKLLPQDFQGACFTISSLGGIGGTFFTPIVNAPEVAILGVSRSQMKPIWNGKEFEPRLMLPLSLSYDHRVIDGASAARFIVYLGGLFEDLRRLLL